jgi:hypothetical protein
MVTKVAEMTSKDPYKDSPYDASGMPLGCETVDYDNQKDVAKATVKDKPVEHPESINDIDYVPAEIDPDLIRRPEDLPKENFNTAIRDNVNPPFAPVKVIDFEDVGEKRELIVAEAEDKGFTAVQELPKVEKQETVDEIKEDIQNKDDADFLQDEEEEK